MGSSTPPPILLCWMVCLLLPSWVIQECPSSSSQVPYNCRLLLLLLLFPQLLFLLSPFPTPTFFPESYLPPAPIAPRDFSSPLSSSSSSQSLTQLSAKESHPSPDSFPPTGSRTLECQHSRRWGSSHHEKELGSGGRAAHVQQLLCNNNKPVLHNNIMLACLRGLACCCPSLLSTHLCDQIFSQNLITTHLRKKHQKSS